MDARHEAFFEALFAKSGISDPTVEQVNAQHQQAISAADAAKAVRADPNNLGGSSPGDIRRKGLNRRLGHRRAPAMYWCQAPLQLQGLASGAQFMRYPRFGRSLALPS
jgi:hypothetical protein